MIDPAVAFQIGNLLAIAGWLLLLVALFGSGARERLVRAVRFGIVVLLSLAYPLLIAAGFGEAEGGGFGSIGAVRALFASDATLTAGWLHYLAFDLFVGSWIAQDGRDRGIPALLLVPCLVLTFLFGPVGLLLFLALRAAFGRRAAATEIAA